MVLYARHCKTTGITSIAWSRSIRYQKIHVPTVHAVSQSSRPLEHCPKEVISNVDEACILQG